MGKRLGDICRFQSGGTPARGKSEYFNGNIPWITTTALNGTLIDEDDAVDWITDKAINESAAKIVPAYSIMVGTRVGVGKVAINKVPMSTNQDIISLLDIDEDKWDKSFLCMFIQSRNFFLNSQARGATIKGIKIDALSDLIIPNISLEKQRNIHNIIDKVREIILLRQSELNKLDNLIKARFVEMFGDTNCNDKSWNIGTINDIGTCVSGATPSTKVPKYWECGDIPWMSSGEVNKGRIYETDTMISQAGYDNASTKMVPPKTVVLAMAGQGKTRGTAAITEIELCTNQSICSIVNNEKVNPEYLLVFLKLQYKELRSASTNTDGRGGLNLKIIGNFPIMIPPIELQNEFALFAEQIDKSKVAVQKALDETQMLFDSLMQKYFG